MKKLQKISLSLILLTIFSLALGAAWTSKRLSNNTGSSYNPAIAVDGANVYVAWHDSTPGSAEIYFRKSTDNGSTWPAAKRITFTSGFSGCPDIAANGSTVYIVYQDDTAGNSDIYFRKSTDGGATWEAAKNVTDNWWESYNAKIAISGSNIFVVWQDNTPGNYEIYFKKSTDAGVTWQSQKRLTNNSGASLDPDIVSYDANLYVVWHDDSSGDKEICFRRSLDGGDNWQSQKQLTSNAGLSEYAAIAVGGSLGSDLYVVWQDSTPGKFDIHFRKSTDKGATWETCKNLTHNSGDSNCPSIAVRGANVYVTWYDITPGTTEIYVKKSADSGSTWQSSKRITNNVGASNNPVIALSASNQYVTFHDYTPGNYEIFVKYAPL